MPKFKLTKNHSVKLRYWQLSLKPSLDYLTFEHLIIPTL